MIRIWVEIEGETEQLLQELDSGMFAQSDRLRFHFAAHCDVCGFSCPSPSYDHLAEWIRKHEAECVPKPSKLFARHETGERSNRRTLTR